MTKISQVLKRTHKKQIVGNLVEWKIKGGKLQEPKGYCALGVLACNKNLITPEKNPAYEKILMAYGIPKDLRKMNFYDELQFSIPRRNSRKDAWYEGVFSSSPAADLQSVIVRLNDRSKLNFKEIGEFLETNLGL